MEWGLLTYTYLRDYKLINLIKVIHPVVSLTMDWGRINHLFYWQSVHNKVFWWRLFMIKEWNIFQCFAKQWQWNCPYTSCLVAFSHKLHSHQVTVACCTEVVACQSWAEYSSRPTTGAKQWWVCWLQCLIRKWSCANFHFKLHTQVTYKPTYMMNDVCYTLLFITGTDIKFIHTNSAIHSFWHSRSFSLLPVIGRLCSEECCFIFWWLVLHMSTSAGSCVPYMILFGAEVIDT